MTVLSLKQSGLSQLIARKQTGARTQIRGRSSPFLFVSRWYGGPQLKESSFRIERTSLVTWFDLLKRKAKEVGQDPIFLQRGLLILPLSFKATVEPLFQAQANLGLIQAVQSIRGYQQQLLIGSDRVSQGCPHPQLPLCWSPGPIASLIYSMGRLIDKEVDIHYSILFLM